MGHKILSNSDYCPTPLMDQRKNGLFYIGIKNAMRYRRLIV